MSYSRYDRFPAYVPVATRRRLAARKIAALRKAGRQITPVTIAGRAIATTFWGAAWCTNLECYSDYENRLPRGRTYVRNGSVLDLQIRAGVVKALVSGTEIYEVRISVAPLPRRRWHDNTRRCAGKIDSLVELLQGNIAAAVMEVVTRPGKGLFPAPEEIHLRCSCPDWATMCKHVAATLYGVGARLDEQPELLFRLRDVDPTELVEAAIAQPPARSRPRSTPTLADDELSAVFGVDIDFGDGPEAGDGAGLQAPQRRTRKKGAKKKGATKKAAKKKAATKNAPTKKAATKKAATKKAATKKAPTKKAPTKKAATKKASKKKAATKNAPTKKAAKKKAAAKKAAAKKGARKNAPKKKGARKNAPKKKGARTKKTAAHGRPR